MDQFRIGKIGSTIELSSGAVAAISLCVALLGIASASVLIVVAEQEIGPNAITCNRLGMASIAFGLWNGLISNSVD